MEDGVKIEYHQKPTKPTSVDLSLTSTGKLFLTIQFLRGATFLYCEVV